MDGVVRGVPICCAKVAEEEINQAVVMEDFLYKEEKEHVLVPSSDDGAASISYSRTLYAKEIRAEQGRDANTALTSLAAWYNKRNHNLPPAGQLQFLGNLWWLILICRFL